MNMTEGERLIFNMLKKGPVTMADLAAKLGIKRQAVTVRVKYLSAKIAPEGWIIKNTNSLGRGRQSIYEMEKKF